MSDVFISHASSDKSAMARPLADRLVSMGLSVWYDEYELRPGDSLRESIDKGLRECRVGVVILSEAFFARRWTQLELNALVATARRVVPVWLGVDHGRVAEFSPLLADVVGIDSSIGLQRVAEEIVRGLGPRRMAAGGRVFLVTKELGQGGTVDESNSLAIEEALLEIRTTGRTGFEIDYERDVYVNGIAGYDRILDAELHDFMWIYSQIGSSGDLAPLLRTLDSRRDLSIEDRRHRLDVVRLLGLSNGFDARVYQQVLGFLRRSQELRRYYAEPRSVSSTVTNFLRLTTRISVFREWDLAIQAAGTLRLDVWSCERPGLYFKVSLDSQETDSYLRVAGMSMSEFYRVMKAGVRASELSDEVVVAKAYPALLESMLHLDVQVGECQGDLLDMNNYATGLA